MKKVFTMAVMFAALFFAGNVKAQMSINVGYAPETFVSTTGSYAYNTNYQGFFVGLTYNFNLVKGLGVAVGPQFRMNTKSESNTLLGITTTTKENQIVIDVPVLLNYGIKLNSNIAVTPFVGPMVSYAVSGKTTTSIGNSSTTSDWYGNSSNMSRFNLNAVFGAAASYSRIKLFGGYRIGLLDLDNRDNTKLKTSGFFVGLGLRF